MPEHGPPTSPEVFDFDEPFDPQQWAMHGLLTVYYAAEKVEFNTRLDESLRRARGEIDKTHASAELPISRNQHLDITHTTDLHRAQLLRTRIIQFISRRWALSGGLAAAVFIAAAGLLTLLPLGQRAARAGDAREPYVWSGGGVLRAGDAQQLAEARARIAAERQARDELRIGAARHGVPTTLLHHWTRILRGLRDLGQLDEALAETQDAVDFTASRPVTSAEDWRNWRAIFLNDLGTILAAEGRFAEARQAFQDSIDMQKSASVDPDSAELPQAQAADVFYKFLPLYWQLARVAIAEGNLTEARAWMEKSERLLCRALRRECEEAGINVPNGLSAIELWRSGPTHLRDPIEAYTGSPDEAPAALPRIRAAAIVVKLREHLLFEARLRRLEGELAGAQRALDDCLSLPYLARHHEINVLFHEPMEAARIALARKDYVAALAAIEVAATHTGPVIVPRSPADREEDVEFLGLPPIGLMEQADLDQLYGAVLMSSDAEPNKGEARRLIRQALQTRDAFVDQLTGEARQRFLKQFDSWDKLNTVDR